MSMHLVMAMTITMATVTRLNIRWMVVSRFDLRFLSASFSFRWLGTAEWLCGEKQPRPSRKKRDAQAHVVMVGKVEEKAHLIETKLRFNDRIGIFEPLPPLPPLQRLQPSQTQQRLDYKTQQHRGVEHSSSCSIKKQRQKRQPKQQQLQQ